MAKVAKVAKVEVVKKGRQRSEAKQKKRNHLWLPSHNAKHVLGATYVDEVHEFRRLQAQESERRFAGAVKSAKDGLAPLQLRGSVGILDIVAENLMF